MNDPTKSVLELEQACVDSAVRGARLRDRLEREVSLVARHSLELEIGAEHRVNVDLRARLTSLRGQA